MNDRWHRRTLAAFWIGAVIVAHTALASDPPEQQPEATQQSAGEVTVLINMRPLDPEEQEIYLRYEDLITTQITSVDDTAFVVTVRELVDSIDGLPDIVHADAKYILHNKLIDALSTELDTRAKLGPKHLLELLDSGNPQVVSIAVSSIRHMPDDWWADNAAIERRLLALLQSRNTSSDLRADAMWCFFLAGRMDRAREAAIRLAESGDATLARTAAYLSCAASAHDEFDSDRVTALFRDSSGVLRQEAALALARFDDFDEDDTLYREVMLQLISIAKDKAEAPVVRGKAIERMRSFAEDETVYRFLATMLEPPNWFFGVRDHHGPSHSLVAVIEALRGSDSPALRPLVLETQARLSDIPDDQRMNVEIALRISLEDLEGG